MADGHLIQSFAALQKKSTILICEVCEICQEFVVHEELIDNCVDCDLKSVEIVKLFDDFKQTILAKIDYSKATDLKPSYVCSDSYQSMFRVIFDGNSLKIQRIMYDEDGENMCGLTKHYSFNQEPLDNVPTHVFPLHSNDETLRILILTKNLKAWLVNPYGDSLELKKVPYPTRSQFLWPYRVNEEDDDDLFYWSYWDESEKMIRFTHSDDFSIPCEVMPFIKMSCSNYFLLCFLVYELVVLVDVRQNSYEEITLNLFGTNVSCFSTYFSSPSNNQITRHSIKALILWSLKDKSVQVCFKEAGKWHSVPARYQPNCCLGDKLLWNYAEKNSGMMLTYEFTVGIYDCSFKLLPLVKEPDNTLIEVFAHETLTDFRLSH